MTCVANDRGMEPDHQGIRIVTNGLGFGLNPGMKLGLVITPVVSTDYHSCTS